MGVPSKWFALLPCCNTTPQQQQQQLGMPAGTKALPASCILQFTLLCKRFTADLMKRDPSDVYMQSGNVSAVADLGGSILTGIDGNPLAVLAKQLHIPLHVIDEADVPLYQADGREANAALDQEASIVLQLRAFAPFARASSTCPRTCKKDGICFRLTVAAHMQSTAEDTSACCAWKMCLLRNRQFWDKLFLLRWAIPHAAVVYVPVPSCQAKCSCLPCNCSFQMAVE